LDGNSLNNDARNLAWMSQEKNCEQKRDHGTLARGIQVPTSKLTESQVLEIQRQYSDGGISQRSLAKEFGVSQTMIGHIVRGENWAWLDPASFDDPYLYHIEAIVFDPLTGERMLYTEALHRRLEGHGLG